jgi:pyruvate/2-oxoacid:ferredoxin oxidoreductase beta subunit/Pyruvate/2-oxoacid:ferredoxin oxidoreductase gamma subunit
MNSLLNINRPPAFCPGCAHEQITHALDKAFQSMGLNGNEIVIVSDIGCSGLFDTFFHTHAFHGLHGRALTYAAGLKLARPELNVIVTMGDGGLGIGGAHLLSACRRNLDMTLLILNNFNFGMTGGQFSATTPADARVSSGFLNQLEKPIDVCRLAGAGGAAYVSRCSAYQKDLPERMERAIRFNGFSILDIWGVCPGRYTRQNPLSPRKIEENLAALPPCDGAVPENQREEYGDQYRKARAGLKPILPPASVEARYAPPETGRQDVVILGDAGQRILTAGEILCLAGMSGGLQVTQKNDYNITVLRGPSISEIILSPDPIGFTGIEKPSVILALGQEGVDRRKDLFPSMYSDGLIIQVKGVEVPQSRAKNHVLDLKDQKIKRQDWAVAALSVLARMGRVISVEMFNAGLSHRFSPSALNAVLELTARVLTETDPQRL